MPTFPNITATSTTSDVSSLWSLDQSQKFREIEENRMLFRGQHEMYWVLPDGETRAYDYMTINWLGVISDTWKRFMFRKPPTIIAEHSTPELEKFIESLDLLTLSLSAELRKSYAGTAWIKGYYSKLSKAPQLILWGANEGEYVLYEYLATDLSKPIAVDFFYTMKYVIERASGKDDIREVMIRERHQLMCNKTGDIVGTEISNTAHNLVGGVPQIEQVDWAIAWAGVANPPQQQYQNNLTELPIVTVHNFDREGDGDGDSDYTNTLKCLQKNVNKIYAVRQLVIDMSEQPLLVVPIEYMDKNGKLDMNLVRLRTKENGEDADEIQVTNWTGNLENSDKQIQFYKQEFYMLTGISSSMSGVLDSEARSGLARRMGMVCSEAEITARRHQWDKAYRQILKLALMLSNEFGGTNFDVNTYFIIQWADAIPQDSTEMVNALVSLLQNYGMSMERVVELLPYNETLTKEQIRAEIGRCKKAQEAGQVVDPFATPGQNGESTKQEKEKTDSVDQEE